MAKDLDAIKQKIQTGAYVPFPLKNVIIRHPHLDKPDNHFDPGGDGKYKVCLIVPEDVANDMQSCGFNVKTFDDGAKYIQATRKPSLGKPRLAGAILSPTTPKPRYICIYTYIHICI